MHYACKLQMCACNMEDSNVTEARYTVLWKSVAKLCLKFTMPLPVVLFLSCLLLQSNEKAVEGIVNTSLWRKHAKCAGLKYSAPTLYLYMIFTSFSLKSGGLAPNSSPMSTVFCMVGGSGHVVTIQTNYVNIVWVTWKNLTLNNTMWYVCQLL